MLPLEFARVSVPVKPSSEATDVEVVAQVAQVILPAALIASGPLALTTKVPLASGIVIVLPVVVGVANVSVFVMPLLVEVRLVVAPCKVRF